jgi:protoporphyrinogen/coproporphyrinogen III oxidase
VPRVVVIGAGIAGLTLAYRLRAQLGDGGEVVVLEQSDRLGGYLRSEQREGFLIESGPNGFLDNAPDTLALVGELGLRSSLTVSHDSARRRFVFRHGRLHLLPASATAFLRSGLLSLGAKLRIAAEPFAGRKPDRDETIDAFAARRLGREAADVLIDPMVSGVVAGDARQLSLQASFPTIWEL